MRQLKKTPLLILIVCFLTLISKAQDNDYSNTELSVEIPEVALLSLKSASPGSINLAPQAPDEAGVTLNFSQANNSDVWVNYSSISKNSISSLRHVDVAINRNVPEGILLKLFASSDAGYGGGNVGIPTGVITLSDKQQEVISGIGSCYTGAGVNKGHRITYFLEIDNENVYSLLEQKSIDLTVTFTLSSGD
jgi:hypothetical protein